VQASIAFFRSLGASRIIAMGAVTIALIGFFAFLIMRVTAPQMTTLFTDLTPEDSAAIMKDLERQSIPYEMRNEGAVLMVPKERVNRLRMKLAESGLPKGGGVGYEIFDKSDALGATSFIQNINHLRALEGELSRTIRALDRVQSARVHLVLPERPLFSREKAEPSASIVLKVRGSLDPAQVRAIRHLAASAVNGLKPQRVSIVDETGRLLADGNGDQTPGGVSADERKVSFEKRMRDQVESIVTSVVGPGRARVQLTADFDFNRITQTSDRFDPESRVVRSSQTREEIMAAGDNKEGQVTVANDLPGAQQRPAEPPAGAQPPRDQNRKTEEIVNYEISRTTKTEVTEGGRLNRISVAVVVDGNYVKNDKGELAYEPRNKEDIERIAGAGAHRDRLERQTRRPGRGCEHAARRDAVDPDCRAHRLAELPAIHQGRRHAGHRAWRDGAARPVGPILRGAAAAAPRDGHRPGRARGGRRVPAGRDRGHGRWRPRPAGGPACCRPRASTSKAPATAASPQPAGRTSRWSAATPTSTSRTARRR
jgi:flagellar M-ring protein FliF